MRTYQVFPPGGKSHHGVKLVAVPALYQVPLMLISYLPLGDPKLHPEQDQEKVGRLLGVAEPFAGELKVGVPDAGEQYIYARV